MTLFSISGTLLRRNPWLWIEKVNRDSLWSLGCRLWGFEHSFRFSNLFSKSSRTSSISLLTYHWPPISSRSFVSSWLSLAGYLFHYIHGEPKKWRTILLQCASYWGFDWVVLDVTEFRGTTKHEKCLFCDNVLDLCSNIGNVIGSGESQQASHALDVLIWDHERSKILALFAWGWIFRSTCGRV